MVKEWFRKHLLPKFKVTGVVFAVVCLVGLAVYLLLWKNPVLMLVVISFMLALAVLLVVLIAQKRGDVERENRKLDEELKEAEKELERLRHASLNVLDVQRVLKLNCYEIDTTIYSVLNQEVKEKNTTVRYMGTLKLDIKAEYGVDIKEIVCSLAKDGTLYLDNIRPRFLSFSSVPKKSWMNAEVLEKSKTFNIEGGWKVASKRAKAFAEVKEAFVTDLEQRLAEEGPMELKFLEGAIKKSVNQFLELMLKPYGYQFKEGLPRGKDDVAVPFMELLKSPKKYLT